MNKMFIRSEDKEVYKYFKDVSKYPILSKYEELELYDKWDNDATRDKIIKSNLRLVINIAKKNLCPGVSLMDLIEEGNIALMESYDKFDRSKGFRFCTFAGKNISQKMIKFINDNGKFIKLPSNYYRDIKYNTRNNDNISIIENDIAIYDKTISKIESEDLSNEIDFILNKLSPRSRKILEMTFGINRRKKNIDQIASHFGLTKSSISRINKESLNKLRKLKNIKILAKYLNN